MSEALSEILTCKLYICLLIINLGGHLSWNQSRTNAANVSSQDLTCVVTYENLDGVVYERHKGSGSLPDVVARHLVAALIEFIKIGNLGGNPICMRRASGHWTNITPYSKGSSATCHPAPINVRYVRDLGSLLNNSMRARETSCDVRLT